MMLQVLQLDDASSVAAMEKIGCAIVVEDVPD